MYKDESGVIKNFVPYHTSIIIIIIVLIKQ